MIKYNSIEEVKTAVNSGVAVNWLTALYVVKIDFEGDYIIKSTSTAGQELLSDQMNPNDFFTNTKTL